MTSFLSSVPLSSKYASNASNITTRLSGPTPILSRAELSPSLRLYDIRHSGATLLLAANEHPKIVSERLGHSSVTITLDVHSHVLPSMQQGASDKLERFQKTASQLGLLNFGTLPAHEPKKQKAGSYSIAARKCLIRIY